LYRKILEKRIDNQQNVEGIISFWNKWQSTAHLQNKFMQPEDNASKIKNTEYFKPVSTNSNTSLSEAVQTGLKPLTPNVKVTNETIISCENSPLIMDALMDEVIAKIPVVLAEFVIQLNVDSVIDLHEPIYQLHKSKKHLHITKCQLIQNTNILFIKGFVRNSIEYYKSSSKVPSLLDNKLRDCCVDIPFKCTTAVFFNGILPAAIIPSNVQEFEFGQHLIMETPNHNDLDDYWQLNQISTAFYNEHPFCEIASSKIVELDIIHNNNLASSMIEENLVLYITLKILQYRQVAVSSSTKK
jgi:hypothetical protein